MSSKQLYDEYVKGKLINSYLKDTVGVIKRRENIISPKLIVKEWSWVLRWIIHMQHNLGDIWYGLTEFLSMKYSF